MSIKMISLKTKLEEIRKLPDNWDSYGAEAPSEICCSISKLLLENIEGHGFIITSINATGDSSILLKHFISDWFVTWEIDDDGKIGVMAERDGNPPEYFDTRITDFDLFFTSLKGIK